VKDSDGVPLDAPAAGGFTTIAAVSVLGSDFQHVHVAWTSPDGAHVRWRAAGTSGWPSSQAFAAGVTEARLLLTPGKTWDVEVAPLDGAGAEQAPTDLPGIATDFTGAAGEWEAAQLATGERGGHFRFTWSDDEFFAAWSSGDDSTTLQSANGDALWIAFDTDPATDALGEVRTKTLSPSGVPEIIWPFNADFVVELKNGAVNLRTVASDSWAPAAAGVKSAAAIDEFRFAKSLLGGPASVRIAFAAVGTTTGTTFDLAPARQAAIEVPTTGQLASVTSSFAPLAQAFDPSAAAAAATSATAHAAALVHFTVADHAAAGAMKIAGSIAPLGYDLSLSDYQLAQTDAQTWEGVFNLGGQAGELFFKFMDAGAPEPAFAVAHVDRVYTLSGATEPVPPLSWSTPYSKTHAFTITFAAAGAPEVRGNVDELGNWGTTSGPAPGAVAFGPHDFTLTPFLQFKAFYGPGSTDYEGGSNHVMNDDVINKRTLAWTPGDSSSF
jgi:hypothetical protein